VRLVTNIQGTHSGAPWLLDLFCGAGGAAMGYWRAGFNILGIDIVEQPRYPFWFVRADALSFAQRHGHLFDAIHASPPCQAYSVTRNLPNVRKDHPDLVEETRETLIATGKPYVIENVVGAPLHTTIRLCGLMFGLKVLRHREFESSVLLFQPPHPSHRGVRIGQEGFVSVAGKGGPSHVSPDHRSTAAWCAAMKINWMTQKELAQAIPPDYTEYIGHQLMRHISRYPAGHRVKSMEARA